MKKLAFSLLLLAAASAARGEDAASLYREGKFEQAGAAYQALVSASPDDGYLHYNLGNCYFKSNRPGKAVASYRRAMRLMPRDPDIRYNLALALRRSGGELVPPGVPEILHRLYYWLSDAELKGLSFAFLWLACLAGGAAFLSGAKFPRPVFLGCVLAAAFFAAWHFARSPRGEIAVAVDGICEVRGGPGENFAAAAAAAEGRELEILGQEEDWYEVSLPKEGIKGWAKKTSLEII